MISLLLDIRTASASDCGKLTVKMKVSEASAHSSRGAAPFYAWNCWITKLHIWDANFWEKR